MIKKIASPFIALALILSLMASACADRETLTIFHAGSLAVPFDQMEKQFETRYGVNIDIEGAGSRTVCRWVTELGKNADVVAVADYTVIDDLMFPEYADWHICFARNEMVIAYTENSKYDDEINADNWYEILLRDGVEYGHSDPDLDPCGYRTLMAWQLAEAYYGVPGLYRQLDEACPKKNTRPKSVELIALLQAGELDYAFEYRSVAQQHELGFVELPPEINLSNLDFEDFYATAEVEVSGKKPGETVTYAGKAIVYAITIPRNAPHPDLAISLIKFLLGPEGQAIMENCGQPPIVPAIASDRDRLPEVLKEFVLP